MSVADMLRQDALDARAEADRIQGQIEDLEARLTKLRDNRDDLRLRAGELDATAHFLDFAGHKVERFGRELRVSIANPTLSEAGG